MVRLWQVGKDRHYRRGLWTGSVKCLLADPTPQSLRLVQSFGLRDFRITPARDVGTALRLYESMLPELVLLDLELPYPGALNAIQEIRKSSLLKKKNPIIIALGKSGAPQMIEQLRQQGADGYLLKPITWEKFGKQLQRFFPETVFRA